MKLPGALIKKFIEDGWDAVLNDENWYVETDESTPIWDDEGRVLIDPNVDHDPVELLGHLQWQGFDECPSSIFVGNKAVKVDPDGLDPGKVIKAWASTLDAIRVTVSVPSSKLGALAKWLDKAGGSIVEDTKA